MLTMQRLSPVLGKYHGQSVSLSLSNAKSSERQNAPKQNQAKHKIGGAQWQLRIWMLGHC